MNEASKYIALREASASTCKTRIYVRAYNLPTPVHVSHLYGKGLREVSFHGGFVDYVLEVKGNEDLELYEVVCCSGACYTKLYRVSGGLTTFLGELESSATVSTGNAKLDKLVDDVLSYRAFWARELCGATTGYVEEYDVLLRASTAIGYYLFGRVKDTWSKLSSEYLGFAYALVHGVLVKTGYHPFGEDLAKLCKLAESSEEPVWRGYEVKYRKADGSCATVYPDKRVGNVTPDLLVATQRGYVVFECKQGPPQTWLQKAAKQAMRYRYYVPGLLLLLTPRKLESNQLAYLLEHYDHVIDDCGINGYEVCMASIRNAIGNSV